MELFQVLQKLSRYGRLKQILERTGFGGGLEYTICLTGTAKLGHTLTTIVQTRILNRAHGGMAELISRLRLISRAHPVDQNNEALNLTFANTALKVDVASY